MRRSVGITLALTSCAQIFRMLTPCLEPLPDGTRLHRADLAVDCDSDTFSHAFNTAIVLIFIYPLGVPATCERAFLSAHPAILTSRALSDFALLYRHRERINPPNCDRLDQLRIRKDDPELQHISFLFSCYSPSMYAFEIVDSYRRIIMQGILTFCGISGWRTVRVSLRCLLPRH